MLQSGIWNRLTCLHCRQWMLNRTTCIIEFLVYKQHTHTHAVALQSKPTSLSDTLWRESSRAAIHPFTTETQPVRLGPRTDSAWTLRQSRASLSFEALSLASGLKSWTPYQLLSVTLQLPASGLMIPHAFFSLKGQGSYDMRLLARISCGMAS